MICRWCKRDDHVCMNTRDMEDAALTDDLCWQALIDIGGGERGLKYVRLNRESAKAGRGG